MVESSTAPEVTVRERILDATLEVIAADGLDAVRHRRVAELAGVSPGSTTYHFASRDDLIEAAFAHYLDEATAVLGAIEVPRGRDDDPARTLATYVHDLISREFLDPRSVRAEYELILHATRTPTLARRLTAWEDAQAEAIAGYLRATGAVDPESSARLVLALVRGLEIEQLVHPARGDDAAVEVITPVLRPLWVDRDAPEEPERRG